METKQVIEQIKADETRTATVSECAIGTMVMYCGEPRIIIGMATGVVDTISPDYKDKSRFSSALVLPVAEKMQVTVSW